jgi:NAD(P)H-nitrite reductase large subunit
MGRANVACVLGGGLIGLKAAWGLKKRNLETKVIVKSNQVLSQVLDEQAASLFRKRLEDNGIEVMTGLDVTEILGNGDVKAVKFDTGKVIGCEIVIVGKGVKPNIDLILDTEIKLNEGILVDEYMKTNLPNIYAAGDVCEAFDFNLGQPVVNALWPHAVEQGKLAGINMAGSKVKYEGSVGMNSVEFFNLPVISMGITRAKKESGFEEMIKLDPKEEVYKKVVLKENRIVGMIFVGKIEQSGVILKLMKEKIDISNIKDELLDDSFNYARVIDLLREDELSVTDRLLIGRDRISTT